MAIRKIIEIDVEDASFKTFQEAFARYQDAVKDLPGGWSKVSAATARAGSGFGDAVAALLAGNEQLARANREAENLGRTAHTAGGSLQKMVHSSREIAGNFVLATKSLLKWSGIATALSGLAGFGGLFGLDRLASSVSSGRRKSMGLGVSSGALQAWGVDLKRVIDPSQFLSAVNRGVIDPTSQERIGLLAAGVPAAEIATGDTSQIGLDLLRREKALADRTPLGLLAPTFKALQQTSFIGPEAARRLKALSPDELRGEIAQTRRDARAFNLSDPTQKKWQDFQVQMSRAGREIETVFIKDLTPLTPALTRLSSAFAVAVDDFLRAPQIKEWINDLAIGIKNFAGYLETPAFAKNIQDFISAVGVLAADTVAVAKWLNNNLPSTVKAGAFAGAAAGGLVAGPAGIVVGAAIGAAAAYKPPAAASPDRQPFSWWNPGSWLHHRGAPDPVQKFLWGFNPIGSARAATEPDGHALPLPVIGRPGSPAAPLFSLPRGPVAPMPDKQMNKLQPVIDQLEKLGWSPAAAEGTAANVWKESYANPRAVGDSGLAYGIGQWHADRQALFAKWAGRPIQGSSVAEQTGFINYELHHGDRQAQLAGHMLATAKTARDAAAIISKYYERPRATQREEISRAALAAGIHAAERKRFGPRQRQQARIVIENRTGSSPVITTAALAGPT